MEADMAKFTDAGIQTVWEKGREIPDFDSKIWRWDDNGKVIKRSEYGNRNSKHGWEIDHIRPVADGGTDGLANLRPLHWETNASDGGRLGGAATSKG